MKVNRAMRRIVVALVLSMTGCAVDSQSKDNGWVPPPIQGIPAYRDLVGRYNKNIAKLDQLRARADVEITWYDHKGRKKFQSGDDSLLMMRRPGELALSIGKLGHDVVWAGYDEDRFWLFDLSEEKTSYVGYHENIGKIGARSLPTPVRPMDLPKLLGVVLIDPEKLPPRPRVEWIKGRYVIEPPGTRMRLTIDPKTYLAARVDLLDATAKTLMFGRLSKPKRVDVEDVAKSQWPYVAGQLDVTMIDQRDKVTLKLWGMSDGAGRIQDRQFDYERLVRAFKPKTQIDLDEHVRD